MTCPYLDAGSRKTIVCHVMISMARFDLVMKYNVRNKLVQKSFDLILEFQEFDTSISELFVLQRSIVV